MIGVVPEGVVPEGVVPVKLCLFLYRSRSYVHKLNISNPKHINGK